MKRSMQWESANELNAFRLLDADAEVKGFAEQPCIIEYVDDGKLRKHTPDILVEFREGRKELWEIKTANEASHTNIAARTSLLSQSLPHFGYRYRVVLAQDLQLQPRLRNTITLLRYGSAAL
ncbi:MAG TPA: TnsA endonuclease N-terminal domain-containing protein [Terracidiphilus sp.]|nr:TnsA endonuclease N-terminal domain-containing protein [Terracidiphilus sp.]